MAYALTDAGRSFVKPLRYDRIESTFPDFKLLDTSSDSGGGAGHDEHADLCPTEERGGRDLLYKQDSRHRVECGPANAGSTSDFRWLIDRQPEWIG